MERQVWDMSIILWLVLTYLIQWKDKAGMSTTLQSIQSFLGEHKYYTSEKVTRSLQHSKDTERDDGILPSVGSV